MTAAAQYNATEYELRRLTMEHVSELARAYQAQHGLVPDGFIGPKTRAVLNAVLVFPEVHHGLPPEVEAWRPDILAALKAEGLEGDSRFAEFLLRWILVESGGNPCSEGIIRADGFHTEAGIGQLYFERGRDEIEFGVTSDMLRSTCTGSHVSRPLGTQERAYQAASLVRMAKKYHAVAEAKLLNRGLHWFTEDIFRLTKMVHALPAVLDLLINTDPDFATLRSRVEPMTAEKLRVARPALSPFAGAPMKRVFANVMATVPE